MIYRYKKPGKRGIMPADSVSYYNRIDIGIFLCILEICMAENEITALRMLFLDDTLNETEYVKVAEYTVETSTDGYVIKTVSMTSGENRLKIVGFDCENIDLEMLFLISQSGKTSRGPAAGISTGYLRTESGNAPIYSEIL